MHAMPLEPGTRLGPYEILSAIGAGGMGEVYRARDTRLQRDVAIKILPASVVADDDRLARFTREAQMLAALNHPGIAQIFGTAEVPGDGGGRGEALAMEFVDGEDLAARIARGPLPLDDALAIARQIAEALDYAHERGIVHRDLKPANVKVLPDGTVKVLDFGLAKAVEVGGPAVATGSGPAAARSPTFTSPAMTHMGVILGTAAYMAPEQAKGKPVDRRADIWALGVVLFEMLTGRTLFGGETVTDTIAQVITQPPRFDLLPPATPAAVRRILRRSLEKDPRNRFQSAGDVRIEIDEFRAAPDASESAAAAAPPRSRAMALLPWGIAGALALAFAFVVWRSSGKQAADARSLMRLDVRVGGGETLLVDDNSDGALAVLSPDGQTMVYAATRETVRRLYVRPLSALESKPLSGTDGARQPFFSPDGKWVAFFASGELKKVAITGGAPVSIAPATDARGGAWGADDTIVFSPDLTTGLFKVPASGGTPVALTKPAEGERTHRWPAFLPGGKALLFIRQNVGAAYDDGLIEAVRVETGERKVIVRGGTFPNYLPTGHLVYMRENTLFAIPFDPSRLEASGTAQPVGTGVMTSGGVGAGGGDGAAQIAFASNGTVAYLPGSIAAGVSLLVILDRRGEQVFALPERRDYRDPRFSADGKRLAFTIVDGRVQHVHVLDRARGTTTKVTFEGTANGLPVWSPDGQKLAFYSDRDGGALNIFLVRSDGAAQAEAITTTSGVTLPGSFSPDGTLLAGMVQLPATQMDVVILSLADRRMTPFAATRAAELLPAFSPDGKWIAYQSDESDQVEVYVRPYPGPGGKWQLSVGGGLMPQWTKDGRELVYVTGEARSRVMAVPITVEGQSFKPGKPVQLFDLPLQRRLNATWYDVSRDGTQFAMLKSEDEHAANGFTHVTLVFNFFDEVHRIMAR
jgi:Tol biopolymer transport system component